VTTDDLAPYPEETKRAKRRVAKLDASLAAAGEIGIGARALAIKWLPPLTDGLEHILSAPNDDKQLRVFIDRISKLNRNSLALCVLLGAMEGIGQYKGNYRDTALCIGGHIYVECYTADLFRGYPKAIAKKLIDQYGKKKKRVRRKFVQELFKTGDWKPKARLLAGHWGIERLLEFLPNVFIVDVDQDTIREKDTAPEKILLLTEAAREYAARNVAELIRKNPVWLPTTKAPANWQAWNKGGTVDPNLAGSLTIVSNRSRETARIVQKAISDGTMKPTVDALNALQRVPWTINKAILDVLIWAYENNIKVEGLPPINDQRLPDKGSLGAMTDAEAKVWKSQAAKIKERNRAFMSQRVLAKIDFETAELMAQHDRFWTPMNMDWRGRVYGVPSFNFQRDDRVRALFLFADGQPIGEEGLKWLKVHVANRGDFKKVSRKPFDARIKWTDENQERIERVANDPHSDLWWTEADKPFQFLAACIELSGALAEGPTFVSRLPISFDGSCNGLQHLSAMMRDEETAKLVNLLPAKEPQDIYSAAAEKVVALVDLDVCEKEKNLKLAKLWRTYMETKDTRKVVKQGVMTYVYGSTPHGIAEELRKRKDLPFEKNKDITATRYLAQHIRSTIQGMVKRPTAAMYFLQDLAGLMADNETYIQWTTPSGFPWANRYYKQKEERVRLFLHNQVFRIKLTTGEEEPEIDKTRAKNGAAPNFVHACDAAHLLHTVNAAVAEGITSIAAVHDSFGCLPSHAERFRRIIREEFVRMYEEHDVLNEILECAREELTQPDKRMPSAPPLRGTFDIKKVLDAEFAFA